MFYRFALAAALMWLLTALRGYKISYNRGVHVLFFFIGLLLWGIAGLAINVKLMPASLVPHLLFSVFLWALEKFTRRGE